MVKPPRCLVAAAFLMLLFSQRALSQYQVKHFTTENGLPSNGIKGLQWDESTGFLWIATEAGMVRYNGMSFKTFDINSNPELGSNRIVKLERNAAGKILVAGDEGNLSLVKENSISLFYNSGGLAKNNFNYYCAISASDTLYRQCLKKPWPTNIFSVHNTTLVPLYDTACLAMANGQLYYYSITTADPARITTVPSYIKYVFKTSGQVYYLDSINQLFSFDVYQQQYQKQSMVDESGSPFIIEKENSRLFWQAGMQSPVLIQDGKAWILEKENNKSFRLRKIAAGIPENTLFYYAQYTKNADYLFLGTASKGIYVVHQNQLTSKKPDESNMNQINAFYSQIELPNGNIITNNGTIIGDNPSKMSYNLEGYFHNMVFDLTDSTLIYSRKDSIFAYNKNSYNRRLIAIGLGNENHSYAIAGKELYMATTKGISIIKENEPRHFVKLFNSKYPVQFRPAAMLAIADDKLVLGTCEGLLSFDIKTYQLDTLLKIPFVCIRTLHKEGDYTFIGTYGGGFYVLKNGRIKAMPLDINQYLKYTHCFIKDNNGFYWISTNNGLFKVKLTDIINAYEMDLPQIYYHYLGKEDGMETIEMNGGCTPCALRLKNGNFSFPTMDGMLWFNPEKVTTSLPSGNIYIDKIMVDGKLQTSTSNEIIQLPEKVKNLDISLAINAWCKKENLYVDYKLNNEQWVRVDMAAEEPRISLSNLGYGKYTLLIRKFNGFGVNNYVYSTTAFTIATPFYHQWWFRILAVLAAAGMGYLIFRMRLRQYNIREKKLSAIVEEKTMDLNLKNRQLEKNDEIKTRLISVINHDIITPLKFMHYAGRTMVEKKETLTPDQQHQTISEITQTAKEMEMLSSQILNWIIYQNPNERMQKEEFDLHQLVEMVFGVLQFPAKLKNTTLQNKVPVNFVVYQYMEPLRVLIYNLVLNSINFTKEGAISVHCTADEERINIQVSDNGLGMTTEQIANLMSDRKIIAGANVDNKKGTGLGYMIIKDLLKMMGGTLSITSSKTIGTTVFVSLSVK